VIEGFFGHPWDWSARLSAAAFLRDFRYQFYIYAPKADAFLRRRWREPLPTQTMKQLCALHSRCHELGVSFGIGLTPFEVYLNYEANARMALRSKVLQINEVGVEVLCILFDDMRGDVDDLPDLQARVIADVCGWSNAQSFIVCPTYYSYDSRLARHFGSPAKSYLRDFAGMIDPSIDIFWTGEKVISEGYSAKHLVDVANEIGRRPFIWDNHVSNDSKIRTNHLYLDPSTSSWELPVDLIAGLAINPMNQPYLSRISLCRYRDLLTGAPRQRHVLPEGCGRLFESSFVERLLVDGDLLQDTGLDRFDDDTRRRLLERYSMWKSNPYALEIAAWLRGEYIFDPQCLTT